MLFRSGDSHAAQWFPALEKLSASKKITLSSITKSSCPITVNSFYSAGKLDKSCDLWHTNILKFINSGNFDYIIFSNFDRYGYDVGGKGWLNGVSDFVNKISGPAKIIQIQDTPKPNSDVVACLSTHQKNPTFCDFKSGSAPKVINSKLDYLDPTSWLCQNESCTAVLNGVNVYRDGSHISVSTALNFSSKFEKVLLNSNNGS